MSDLRLPTKADLQDTLDCLTGGGVDIDALGIEQRVVIAKLAIQADIADTAKRIFDELQHVGEWFDKSKLWEGRLD